MYHAVTCQPTHGNEMLTGSDSPPIEGQIITYTCPPGFVLNGPNASVCMRNGKLKPDPGEVECIGDCFLFMHGSGY